MATLFLTSVFFADSATFNQWSGAESDPTCFLIPEPPRTISVVQNNAEVQPGGQITVVDGQVSEEDRAGHRMPIRDVLAYMEGKEEGRWMPMDHVITCYIYTCTYMHLRAQQTFWTERMVKRTPPHDCTFTQYMKITGFTCTMSLPL